MAKYMANPEGVKNDNNKPRWDLLPIDPIEEIVKVLTHGSKKYSDHGWLDVPDRRVRYYSAMMRHIAAWKRGKIIDSESGLSHLAHAACNLIFLMCFDRIENDDIQKKIQKLFSFIKMQ